MDVSKAEKYRREGTEGEKSEVSLIAVDVRRREKLFLKETQRCGVGLIHNGRGGVGV